MVEAAKKHAAPLVGLSALMTTTLGSMEETIRLLRAENIPCKVVVGGAVLTPDPLDGGQHHGGLAPAVRAGLEPLPDDLKGGLGGPGGLDELGATTS